LLLDNADAIAAADLRLLDQIEALVRDDATVPRPTDAAGTAQSRSRSMET